MGKPKTKPNKKIVAKTKKKQLSPNKNAHKKQIISLSKKNLPIVIGACVAIVVIVLIICGAISNKKRIATEENRNYFINIDENFSFDCNLQEVGSSLRCASIEVSGEYSNFDTVYFAENNKIDFEDGGKFKKKVDSLLDPSIYQKDDFNINEIDNSKIEKLTFNLMNSILGREVATKNTQIEFKLTTSDKELIVRKNQEWKEKKAEEEAKKQAEAEQRRIEEEQRKAEEERKRIEEEQRRAKENRRRTKKSRGRTKSC